MNPIRGQRAVTGTSTPTAEEWSEMFLSHQPLILNPIQGRTVLVVESNPTLNRAMCETLEAHEYEVQSAHNGREALAILAERQTDLVVSDLGMPEMDGYDLLKQIRSNPKTRYLPVIFLSGHDSSIQRRRARDSGVVDYLTMPVAEEDLLHSVRSVLKRQSEQEADFHRRVEEMRSQILGLVQHEFRTPLTFVMGYAEFLQDALQQDLPREEIEHSVNAIVEGSRRLHHLVESFLLLANLSRDALPRDEVYPLDPAALWRESLTEVRDSLEDAQIKVVLTESPDPVIVFGVMDLLREALSRLLDNAIRYRRPGVHTIWLATVSKPGYVGWQIRDEGLGISASVIAQLSSPFVRLHPPEPEGHGIGLGLTLVRRVAELHGGYVEIESEEGSGSTFTLWVSDEEVM